MPAPTSPSIFTAQNTQDAQRKVAAQARLYSDAKLMFNTRIALIGVVAVGSAVAALLTAETARTVFGVGGGVLLLLISLIGGSAEKRRRLQAAAVQEDFDTGILRLPWNPLEAKRPSSVVVTRAAERYDGGHEQNWYADTEGIHRPYDVLICQSSNLGWGATTHRVWGCILSGVLATLIVGLSIVAVVLDLPASDSFVALVAPALAPVKEIVEQIKSHFETARDKEEVEATVSTAWADGMSGDDTPSEDLLRLVQNKILSFRQRNHYVPDWLDGLLHAKNERAMQESAADRVAEAARNGHG